MGYFAYCKSATKSEASIKGLLGAAVGYFAYNNPLMKSWFLKSKKDQEMNHLVEEYKYIHSLEQALDNAQINKRAQELFDVDQEIESTERQLEPIKDIPIKDFFRLYERLNRFKDKQKKIESYPLSYEGEIINPGLTIKKSKISAMDILLGDENKNIPWASVDENG